MLADGNKKLFWGQRLHISLRRRSLVSKVDKNCNSCWARVQDSISMRAQVWILPADRGEWRGQDAGLSHSESGRPWKEESSVCRGQPRRREEMCCQWLAATAGWQGTAWFRIPRQRELSERLGGKQVLLIITRSERLHGSADKLGMPCFSNCLLFVDSISMTVNKTKFNPRPC